MRAGVSASGLSATNSPFRCKILAVVMALEKKMFLEIATKRDLQQLKREFEREFTVRMCLILAGATALLFGLVKVV